MAATKKATNVGSVLDRNAIFGIHDIKTEKVFVPEWNGSVFVRGITAYERDDFESSLLDQSKKRTRISMRNARARLVVLATVNEDGSQMFSEEDIAMLSMKSAIAIDHIYEVASAMAGLGDDDLEELLGKSGPIIDADFSTDSASPSE